MADLLDDLAGVAPGSPLDALRARRAAAREHTEASFRALFHPAESGPVAPRERFAVGLYVALLHEDGALAERFEGWLADAALAALVREAAAATAAPGPSGAYPPGPLSRESTPAPRFAPPEGAAAALGPRLLAALAHAHFLVLHPRDAAPERLDALRAAGWDADGVVTLSQIVSFLAYLTRAAAGLRALQEAGPA